MSDPLKVGIAGYGIVGKRRRQCIDTHSRLQTVAVCDQTFDGEGLLDDGIRYYANFERLLEEDLDILFVAMSNDMAPVVTISGLEKGLHVFCEKPPGRDMNDIIKVIACEQNHPEQKLKYGFNHRYHDSVKEALRIVHSGELGNVINLRGVYGKSKLITFDQTSWRTERKLAGGGVLLDQGIHMVDLIRLFAGEFSDIYSFISNNVWNHDVEDNAYALMRTHDGKVAMLHSSATQWRHRFNLEISLSKGSITLSGILSGSKSYGAETLTIARVADSDMGDPMEQTIRYNTDTSWLDEVNEFADVVINGAPIENGSSDDAFKTMGLVYEIYCADKEWAAKWGLNDGSVISGNGSLD